ncbi:MAG: arylsulfatase [Bacteroidia bacterium]
MRKLLLALSLFTGIIWLPWLTSCNREPSRAKPTRPDIILIMADDMGFSDLGCFGGEIHTPNIDNLARNGLSFTQFYNTGRCCPSRASLMTGMYPHTVDMGWMNSANLGRAGYLGRLSDAAVTLPEALKTGGYRTYMVGKWHLTPTDSIKAQRGTSWPTDRGFDEFYGTMEGAKDYFKPTWLFRNKAPVTVDDPHYFYTDAITDTAVAFIGRNPSESPMFLYLAFYAPHFPLHAPDSTVARYRNSYRSGWKNIRANRFERQHQLGLIPVGVRLSDPEADIPGWTDLGMEKRDEMDLRMAIYAAQVEEMDRGVGKVIAALKARGRLDNAIIVFLSDNGALATQPLGRGNREQLNASGPYTDYGAAWSHVSNTPYRLYKGFNHEGGIIAPLIIQWLKPVAARGEFCRQPIHIMDLMPTLASLAGVEVPPVRQGLAALKPEGRSFRNLLLDPEMEMESRPLFWEHEGKRAVRQGGWKLVSPGLKKAWELYSLTDDPTETRDLASQNPDRVRELTQLWDTWAREHHVLPLDGQGWDD